MKIMKLKTFVLTAVAALTLSSCATLFTGTKDVITFRSNPSGAIVYIDGVEQCVTPCTMPVNRSLFSKDVQLALDGYETRMFTLNQEFNLVSVINLGNLFGWAIDLASGAVLKYDQQVYNVKLTKGDYSSALQPTKIDINTQDKTVDLYVVNNE